MRPALPQLLGESSEQETQKPLPLPSLHCITLRSNPRLSVFKILKEWICDCINGFSA